LGLAQSKKYEPENMQNSGGILARQASKNDLDTLVRAGASQFSMHNGPAENGKDE